MHAFDVLGDPVRRRLLELIAEQPTPAGRLAAVVGEEFGISQPAVSQHLRVLRESGFATSAAEGSRRIYALEPHALDEVETYLDRLRDGWSQRLDALGTEIARGRRARRADDGGPPAP